jgi:hypothetical protein
LKTVKGQQIPFEVEPTMTVSSFKPPHQQSSESDP